MTTDFFLAMGILIILGLIGGSLASKLRLPRITGYILFDALLASTAINMLFTPPLAQFAICKSAEQAEESDVNLGSPSKTGRL